MKSKIFPTLDWYDLGRFSDKRNTVQDEDVIRRNEAVRKQVVEELGRRIERLRNYKD